MPSPKPRTIGFLSKLILLASILALPGGLFAQQFAHIDPLYFVKPFGGVDPLPQVLAVASTSTNFNFSVSASTSSGGSWLSVSPGGNCCTTPDGVRAIVTTGVAMAAGTYSGQIVFASGALNLTVPVTLVVAPTSGAFFDTTPGQVSFSMALGGHPPPQTLEIRNGGVGALDWTLTTATSNGGNWLSVSTNSGTAPSRVTVSIVTANLPNAGSTTGTYSGRLLFQTAGGASIVTVPIGLTVAANAMPQVNALNFSKLFAGADPLPQTVTIASSGTAFNFNVTFSNSNGGAWMSPSPSGNCCTSPDAITISASPAVALAVGNYVSQVVVSNGSQMFVIPVTLTISPTNTASFDNVAGQLSYTLPTSATLAPPNQLVQIRNAGAGTLNWSLIATTFDGGNWLTVSTTSGSAPSQVSIGIVPSALPNGALQAGVYTANLLFQTTGSSVTVPITVSVGPGFEQVNGISFTKLRAGPDPLPQVVTIASSGNNFNFSVAYHSASGGNWLSVSPAGNCCTTPEALTATVTTSPTMPVGTYTAEIIAYSGGLAVTVPVTLTVAASGTTYFDNVPGQLSFSMQPAAAQPPSPQVFQIRNGGTGSLSWTLAATTSDGGNWLTVSATSGTAPSLISVGIVPANLPNGGLVAGVFTGQLRFETAGSSVTVPVSLHVATNAFGQTGGLYFTMPQNGANPLPQVVTTISNGTAFNFSVAYSSATGGNWLTVSPSGNCCTTPEPISAIVNAPVGMPAGTYTAQMVFYSGATSQTVPVTLTVSPTNTAFFDNMPGQLAYSMPTASGNPPVQTVQVRNRGVGALDWTARTSTFDGGNWLTISAASGTAPTKVTIGVVTANLPNLGLVAGVYTGQVLFLSANSAVTIPISVAVGINGFVQVNPLHFTMPLGGANPLPQIMTAVGSGAGTNFSITGYNANGGNWMTVSPAGNCCSTPEVLFIGVSAPVGLAAGTYTSEVLLRSGTTAMVVPVSLTVAPANVPYFDNVQGQMPFFAATNVTPTAQTIDIRGLGLGPLNWTLTPMTADAGNWLTLSAASGTAPSTVTVGVDILNLPSQGLVAGQFTGQLLFQSNSGSVTVPVVVQLGPNIFVQMSGLSFTMPYGGANPLTQTPSVTSSGGGLNFTSTPFSGNGGNWLTISPSGNCCSTPRVMTVGVNGSPGGSPVPAGVHTAQAVFNHGSSALTLPVTLTVTGVPAWSISKAHVGNFTLGQRNATYRLVVSNPAAGGAPTNGTATVTETVSAGLTLVSMAGVGWNCPGGNTCTRSDSLASGASYPAITVTVNVSAVATSPQVNAVSVTGAGAGTANATDSTTILPPFTDVPSNSPYFDAINLMRQYSITAGCGANIYCAGDNVSRAQMAIFMVRAIYGGDNFSYSNTPYFNDVGVNDFGFKWIQKMKELGITAGCGGNNYCPLDNITRAQMAVFIIRSRLGTAADATFTYPATPSFTDEPANDIYFKWVQRMKVDQITGGCGLNIYCPSSPVTREQMAIFIMRGDFNFLLSAGTPKLTLITPGAGIRGSSQVYTVTGENTHFVQGTTVLAPIPGVTVGAITVLGPTSLTVELTTAANATVQPYSIVAITGTEEAVLPNGFVIQ